MRLIDGKALLTQLTVNSDGKRISERDCDNFPIMLSISEVKRIIRDAPTIEPVKHGKWFHNPELGEAFRTCSNCQISMGMTEGEIFERFKFCPHCGADMRAKP